MHTIHNEKERKKKNSFKEFPFMCNTAIYTSSTSGTVSFSHSFLFSKFYVTAAINWLSLIKKGVRHAMQ
jgi:hypothetical protein